ncbi:MULTISPECIES: Bug family tripartite tricarboxylate transporter substrate binding protein [Achromobacter]|uniref:Tripartite tricarboxylate transporter substrate binding protein n=1 Tax=Achromobacter spanius TaxID=217203 RepID=A0ABY8GYB2_9BURK|nr:MULTISPECIES: tripartite tricarboxylate transporter substrate binding protein [Achromobacter]WAI80898.1 tripartite tricarboxylate transporter substrate binding protein [Achromobacter spanius]WEX96411.1 tripartite tricarboxylate transporter substrate binding protein [Achromobacter sp. SS2-2022]WFP09869.1 tripartite tricarboxylate transporter substrate binding protein [Achromobacter spanius]
MQKTYLARFGVMLGLVAGLAAPLGAYAADTYPDKPIRIVVPYAAGGGVDIVTRLITQKMAEELKQPVIVDNRPGAATNIGMEHVARAEPDGYTLLTASNTLASNAALFPKLNFNPAKDFAPIGAIGFAPLVVVVRSDASAKTLKDLVAQGRANPDKLTYGSAGNGSSGHLASELLKSEGGFKALHIPYKGGSPAVTDLLGGRLSFMSINPLEVASHVKAGKLRALAVLNPHPAKLLPDVPTAESQGLSGVDATVWWGLVGPAGMPEPVVKRLNKALQAALVDPAFQQRMSEIGAEVTPGSAADFGRFVADESVKWTKVIRAAGISAD